MGPELSTAVNRPFLSADEGGALIGEISVNPGAQTEEVTRQVALVIDVSGSMRGKKMDQAIDGANFALGYLDDEDIVSVVEFNSSATVLTEATRIREVGRDQLNSQVEKMSAGGGTNIYEGLEKATEELRALPSGSDVARRILLLSDGKDNKRGPEDFERQASRVDEHGIRIRAAGIGSEYDEETIRTLGSVARGQWRHVEQPSDIQEFFGEAVEQASTVVGTDAEIRMDIANGVEIAEAYRAKPQVQETDVEYQNGTAVVKLPDLLDRQEQKVQLRMQAPSGELGYTKTLADVTLKANGGTAQGSIEVEYTDGFEKLSQENKEVSIGYDKTVIRDDLGKGNVEEAEEKTKILEDKHGDDAADDVDEMDEQVTMVKEGGRGEQNQTTIVKDNDDGF